MTSGCHSCGSWLCRVASQPRLPKRKQATWSLSSPSPSSLSWQNPLSLAPQTPAESISPRFPKKNVKVHRSCKAPGDTILSEPRCHGARLREPQPSRPFCDKLCHASSARLLRLGFFVFSFIHLHRLRRCTLGSPTLGPIVILP